MKEKPLPKTKEALSLLLQERGKTYLPQWQQNPENPDFGMALLEIYAQIQADTLKKTAQLPEKWKIAFYNSLGCDLLPQQVSQGFVHFGLSSEDLAPVPLKAGTQLKTSLFSGEEPIPLETTQDVMVHPAMLGVIYESYDGFDHISAVTHRGDQDQAVPCALFSFQGENIQKRRFYLMDDQLFYLERQGKITLTFLDQQRKPFTALALTRFIQSAQITYSDGEQFHDFSAVYLEENALVLEKKRNAPGITPGTFSGVRSIAFFVKEAKDFYDFAPYDLLVNVKSESLFPQMVVTPESQVDGYDHYYPFTEKPSVYDEVYFGDNEVFSKKGATITLSFLLEFAEVPLDLVEVRNPTFKFIMPKSSVVIEPEYDLSIDAVIFEYFNGYDYVNLFPQRSHQALFSPKNGTHRQKRSISFPSPQNMAPSLVGGMEICSIRCRILKINNHFKVQGKYISPVLSQTALSYEYPDLGQRPEFLAEENHGCFHRHEGTEVLGQIRPYQPVQSAEDTFPTVYFGFDKPLTLGPVGLLFARNQPQTHALPPLEWSYSSPTGFLPFHCQDETEHFRHSGVLRFMDLKHHHKTERFGEAYYWIRARDMSGENLKSPPCFQGIYTNATTVQSLGEPQVEYFTMEDYEEKPEFPLGQKNIQHIEVYTRVNEALSPSQEEVLSSRLRNFDQAQWIAWDYDPNFHPLKTKGYGFGMDVAQSSLLFSQESKYLLPSPQVFQGIRVVHRRAGGEKSNLPTSGVDGFVLTENFVNFVENPLPLFGGADQERPTQAMARKAQELSHRNRGVTARDYEKIAESFGDFIQSVRCFPHRDGKGQKNPGHLTLVVLCKDYHHAPHFFPWLEKNLQAFLQDKLFALSAQRQRLHIVMPQFIQLNISVEISVIATATAFQCREAVTEALHQFLHPITGNFSGEGFALGQLPQKEPLTALLLGVKGVEGLENLVLSHRFDQQKDLLVMTPQTMAQYPFALPVSGTHKIHITS